MPGIAYRNRVDFFVAVCRCRIEVDFPLILIATVSNDAVEYSVDAAPPHG